VAVTIYLVRQLIDDLFIAGNYVTIQPAETVETPRVENDRAAA
jgi:hypothetical protein